VESRCFQEVDALRQVLIRERVDAFDFDEKAIFDHQIRRIRTDMLALVCDWERRLGFHPHAAKVEFLHQSPFVDLFQEASPEDVAHLISSANDLLHERFQRGTFSGLSFRG
jgi:hypothetical protein